MKDLLGELGRRREWRGWVWRSYTDEQCDAIRHYIKTGEVTGALPPKRKRRRYVN
jgi:hypothetical protein